MKRIFEGEIEMNIVNVTVFCHPYITNLVLITYKICVEKLQSATHPRRRNSVLIGVISSICRNYLQLLTAHFAVY